METIALNCLVFEKIAFFAFWQQADRQTKRQTNKQTDEQLQRIKPLQWRNYGRQWRQSPPGTPGKGAPRADSNVFFYLFNYKILSRFAAANDTALNTLRPIRPCFTANNNQLGL